MGTGDELDFAEENEMENKKTLKLLYGGSSVFCGAIAGIGLGMVCHGMSVLVKR